MAVCAKHDVNYQLGSKCWCCEQETAQVSQENKKEDNNKDEEQSKE